MAQVQIGTILANNDPREQSAAGGGVQVTVVDVVEDGFGQYAVYYTTRKNKIRFDRIFDDGRKRSTGWSVVKQPEA